MKANHVTLATRTIRAWVKAHNTPRFTLRHVFPLAYVIGYAAPRCLVVAVPWFDSEPQCADFDRAHPLKTLRRFEDTLRPGDWCHVAYVAVKSGGESVAVVPRGRTARKGRTG
jgi:hypothetical protein